MISWRWGQGGAGGFADNPIQSWGRDGGTGLGGTQARDKDPQAACILGWCGLQVSGKSSWSWGLKKRSPGEEEVRKGRSM